MEIEASYYADIVGIYGPSKAQAGETVNIDVAVKNIQKSSFNVSVTGQYDGQNIYPTVDYLYINPGQTLHFYFAFQMPNKSIALTIWSFFWDWAWIRDDQMTVNIGLTTLEPMFRSFGVTDYSKG